MDFLVSISISTNKSTNNSQSVRTFPASTACSMPIEHRSLVAGLMVLELAKVTLLALIYKTFPRPSLFCDVTGVTALFHEGFRRDGSQVSDVTGVTGVMVRGYSEDIRLLFASERFIALFSHPSHNPSNLLPRRRFFGEKADRPGHGASVVCTPRVPTQQAERDCLCSPFLFLATYTIEVEEFNLSRLCPPWRCAQAYGRSCPAQTLAWEGSQRRDHRPWRTVAG